MSKVDHTKAIIQLKDVNFTYGSGDAAIQNVNLEVHKGDYLGIVGPNGGGKTTLLKIILGLLTPSHGEVLLYDTNVKKFYQWSKVGYVSQQATHIDPYFPMTVREIVAMGRFSNIGLFKYPNTKDRQAVEVALEKVNMWKYRDRLIGDLSGGQAQRVFIAKALAGEPEIIVLDEPTAGVDVATEKQFYLLLQQLNTELGLTLILVSHELDIVAHEATEIAYINKTLVFYGDPQNFFQSEYIESLTGKGPHTHA